MTKINTHLITPEESSFIRGITYIPEQKEDIRNTQVMEVRLKHDTHGEIPYYYSNIPQRLYSEFINAESYGRFYSQNIKQGSFEREYKEDLEQHSEHIADLIYDVPTSISAHIKNSYNNFYQNNKELIDAVSNRRLDKSILYVKENPSFIGISVQIMCLLVEKIRTKIQEDASSELSEACNDKFDRYMQEMKEYVTVQNL